VFSEVFECSDIVCQTEDDIKLIRCRPSSRLVLSMVAGYI